MLLALLLFSPPRRLSLLLLLAGLYVECLLAWTTVSPIPAGVTLGGAKAALVRGYWVLVVNGDHTHVYNTLDGIWTTVAPQPTSRTAIAAVSASGDSLLVVGGTNPTRVEAYNHAQATWTTLSSSPSGHNRGCGDNNVEGTRLWVAGAEPASTIFHEYTVITDGWTTRKAVPTARFRAGAAFVGGRLAVFSGEPTGTLLEIYTPSADGWTTTSSSPTTHPNLYGAATAIGDHMFVCGSDSSSNLERYHIETDEWITLDPRPVISYAAAFAVANNGIIVAALTHTDNPVTHTYQTGFALASVIGDPVVTTFAGHAHHLSLWPGSFNLLTTPTTLISAVVEVLPTLPPDENTVMTVVAIAGQVGDDNITVHCSAYSAGLVCHCKSARALKMVTQLPNNSSYVIPLPDFVVELTLLSLYEHSPAVGNLPHSWLDVVVRTRVSSSGCVGLLCLDASNALTQYEIPSGCLLETNPSAMAAASAGVFGLRIDGC